jgi:hypothetical protein
MATQSRYSGSAKDLSFDIPYVLEFTLVTFIDALIARFMASFRSDLVTPVLVYAVRNLWTRRIRRVNSRLRDVPAKQRELMTTMVLR